MSLIGTTVKVKDRGLLGFFYPGFIEKDTLDIFDSNKDVIYYGKIQPNLLKSLQVGTRRFINTTGVPDYDLVTPQNIVNFVYEKYSKEPPKYVLDMIPTLDENDLINYAKSYWIY